MLTRHTVLSPGPRLAGKPSKGEKWCDVPSQPGLMDVRVDLACGTVAEVYSVPSPEDETRRRFAVFLCPDTATESEIHAESAEDASNLFALLSSSLGNGEASESRSVTDVHHGKLSAGLD